MFGMRQHKIWNVIEFHKLMFGINLELRFDLLFLNILDIVSEKEMGKERLWVFPKFFVCLFKFVEFICTFHLFWWKFKFCLVPWNWNPQFLFFSWIPFFFMELKLFFRVFLHASMLVLFDVCAWREHWFLNMKIWIFIFNKRFSLVVSYITCTL